MFYNNGIFLNFNWINTKTEIHSLKSACRTNVYGLIPIKDDEYIKYIYYYLNIFRENTNKKAKFTTNLGVIKKDALLKLNIIQTDKIKQKELVDYLDKLENKKNSIDDELKDIDDLMKSILEQSYEQN